MVMHTTTNPEVKAYIGNSLTCTRHSDGGDNDHPGNFLSTATKFPAYSPREGAVITLEDRVANCIRPSMNGTRPSTDRQVVVDMVAYITRCCRTRVRRSTAPACQ